MHLRRPLAVPLAFTLLAAIGCERPNTAINSGNVLPAAANLNLAGTLRVPAQVQPKLQITGLHVAQASPPSFISSPSPSPSPTATALASASPSPSPSASASAAPAVTLLATAGGVSLRFVFISPEGTLRSTAQTVRSNADGSFAISLPVSSNDTLLIVADLGKTGAGRSLQEALLISVRSLLLNPNQLLSLTPGTTAVVIAEMGLAAGKDGRGAVDLLLSTAGGTSLDAKVGLGLLALEASVSVETTEARTAGQLDAATLLLNSLTTTDAFGQAAETLGTALGNAVVRVLKKLNLSQLSNQGQALAAAREALTEVLLAASGKLGSDRDVAALTAALLAAGDQVANDAAALQRIKDNSATNPVDFVPNAGGPVDGSDPLLQPFEQTLPGAVSGVSGAAGSAQTGQQSAGGGGAGL